MFFKKNYTFAGVLYLTAFVAVHFILLLKVKFTAWPEMLAWPYLTVNGWLPYRDIAIAHTPLLLVDLSVFNAVFGVGLMQLKIYTWILIILTDVLIFYVAKKLWNRKVAFFALLIYIPLHILYEGNGLWFDLALAPLALIVFYNLKKSQYFWAGLCFASALLTKQTAAWFIIPVMIYFLNVNYFKNIHTLKIKILAFAAGFIIPIVIFLLTLVVFSLQDDFYQWALKFGILYLPKAQGQILFPGLKQLVIFFIPFSILIPFLIWKKFQANDLVVWICSGLLGIYPRFEYFHFQPALPFLAIGIALLTSRLSKRQVNIFSVMLGLYLLITGVLFFRFVIRNWGKETRFFTDLEKNIATYTISELGEKKEIYVLNYWDSLYAMTNTIPATRPLIPYIPWYLDYNDLKKTVFNDLRNTMPTIIIKGEYTHSGLGSYAVAEIDRLLKEQYIMSFKNENVLIYKLKE